MSQRLGFKSRPEHPACFTRTLVAPFLAFCNSSDSWALTRKAGREYFISLSRPGFSTGRSCQHCCVNFPHRHTLRSRRANLGDYIRKHTALRNCITYLLGATPPPYRVMMPPSFAMTVLRPSASHVPSLLGVLRAIRVVTHSTSPASSCCSMSSVRVAALVEHSQHDAFFLCSPYWII